MYILGIETSSTTGSVALISEDAVIAQYSLNIEVTHSERLMSTVDRVLKDTGLAIGRMDGYAVAIGPGSFTGLRIGLAAVKGLALVTGKPIAAVPTLQALAWNLPHSAHPVCPLLDARRKEVYAATYRFEGPALVHVMAEAVLSLTLLSERVSGKTIFTGEASHLFRREILEIFGERALFAPHSAILPSAASVAEIGLDMIKRGKQADPDSLTPMYIRRPEAEVAWGKKARLKTDFMKKEDVDQVFEIEQVSFRSPWSRNLFYSEFRSPLISFLLVALADDPLIRKVVGYTVFWIAADEMHILNLATAPERRKQGIARSLVLAALKLAYQKGAKRAFLEVRVSNLAAQKLYSNLGFTGTFLRREYYDSPVEDAVMMVLERGSFESLAKQIDIV